MTVHTASELRALSDAHSAHNYHPLPVVIASADGAWVTDVDGHRYVDMLAAYSALNFGHRHPRLAAAARSTMTSSGRSVRNSPSWRAWTWFCR